MRLERTLAVLLLLFASGCFSTSLMQEPRPLPPGHVRGAVALESGNEVAGIGFGARVGLARRTEARIKYMPTRSVDVGVNVQAVDGERFDLMLMPSFARTIVSQGDWHDWSSAQLTVRAFSLPILGSVSLDRAERYQIFVGPELRVGKRYLPSGGHSAAWTSMGVHVGAAITGPHDRVTFVPECSWMRVVAGGEFHTNFRSAHELEPGDAIIGCAVGVTFGMKHTRAQ